MVLWFLGRDHPAKNVSVSKSADPSLCDAWRAGCGLEGGCAGGGGEDSRGGRRQYRRGARRERPPVRACVVPRAPRSDIGKCHKCASAPPRRQTTKQVSVMSIHWWTGYIFRVIFDLIDRKI